MIIELHLDNCTTLVLHFLSNTCTSFIRRSHTNGRNKIGEPFENANLSS